MNENINELINSYNDLTINDKRRELGREIAELSIVIKQLISYQTGIPLNESLLNDYNNLYDGNLSENDYLTGLYEDVINLKEDLGLYFSKNEFDEYEE